jgi:hypothetical protein
MAVTVDLQGSAEHLCACGHPRLLWQRDVYV